MSALDRLWKPQKRMIGAKSQERSGTLRPAAAETAESAKHAPVASSFPLYTPSLSSLFILLTPSINILNRGPAFVNYNC